jgi:hypothetical protein
MLYTNFYSHIKYQLSKNQVPYIALYTIFYIFFFSAIKHKEIRFLMPIIPFATLTIAESIAYNIKLRPKIVSFFVKLYILTEIYTFFLLNAISDRNWIVK